MNLSNGYYEISGVVRLLSRPRRRRVSGGASGVVDVQVAASGDDGRSWSGTATGFGDTDAFIQVGESSPGTTVVDGWARFVNVTIPAGATITVAYITVEENVDNGDGAGTLTDIFMEAADDPTAPTTQADHAGRARTTAFTAWDDIDFTADTPTDSPDIASVIQEIIDRGGWNSGQSMQILWDDGGSTDHWYAPWSYDGNTAKAVKLHVEWSS